MCLLLRTGTATLAAHRFSADISVVAVEVGTELLVIETLAIYHCILGDWLSGFGIGDVLDSIPPSFAVLFTVQFLINIAPFARSYSFLYEASEKFMRAAPSLVCLLSSFHQLEYGVGYPWWLITSDFNCFLRTVFVQQNGDLVVENSNFLVHVFSIQNIVPACWSKICQ